MLGCALLTAKSSFKRLTFKLCDCVIDFTGSTSPFSYRYFNVDSSLKHISNDLEIDWHQLEQQKYIYKAYTTQDYTLNILINDSLFLDISNFDLSLMKIIGHRGSGAKEHSKDIPENTIMSYLNAKNEGAHMIELDVHLTRDGNVFIHHDHSIIDLLVSSLSLSECNLHLRSANHIHIDYPTTLHLTLDALPDDLAVNIEIKANDFGQEPVNPEYLFNLCVATLKITAKYPNKKFLYTSFHPEVCAYIRLLNRNAKVCLLVCHEILATFPGNTFFPFIDNFACDFNLEGFVFSTDFYNEFSADVKGLLAKNKLVFCYGEDTNSYITAEQLYKSGVTGLITDKIKEIKLLN
ncbi:glycerophosphocholine phosphodiesterase GPCPD1 [Enteropsectra breve]|nr:glycerophosphocholine phosphodiesterase GPCPD1 [Enteropsectra breve]